jgi:hypothetical protein
LVLAELRDLLLENHATNCIELVDHALDFVDCLEGCLLKTERLFEDLLQKLLLNPIDIGDKIR